MLIETNDSCIILNLLSRLVLSNNFAILKFHPHTTHGLPRKNGIQIPGGRL